MPRQTGLYLRQLAGSPGIVAQLPAPAAPALLACTLEGCRSGWFQLREGTLSTLSPACKRAASWQGAVVAWSTKPLCNRSSTNHPTLPPDRRTQRADVHRCS